MDPLDEIIKVFENNHVDAPWSHVFVLSLDAIAIFAIVWCVRQVIDARRAARQAKRLEQSTLPIFEGARFVAGTVELAQGATTAIRVTIDQEGTETEYKKKGSHTWTEINRQVEAVPFYVRTASGERVRVEPPVDVMLVDNLDQMEWHAPTRRRRRAELTPEEGAVIEGRLERGTDPELHGPASTYRTIASTGWIMKPTKRKGMYVSAESLSRRYDLRARAFIRATIAMVAATMIAACIIGAYRVRLWRGENVVANYLGRANFLDSRKNGNGLPHYGVTVTYVDDSNKKFDELVEIDYGDWSDLPDKRGQIWLRYVPSSPWATTIGKGASVNGLHLLLSAGILAAGIYFIRQTARHRRWYEGQLIEKAEGHLPPPTKAMFVDAGPKPPIVPIPDRISIDFGPELEALAEDEISADFPNNTKTRILS